jgi:hypothetical protein
MADTIIRTVFALVGLFIFAVGSDGTMQSYEGPVLKESLSFVDGTLTNVTECSNGRSRSFFYTVAAPSGQTVFKSWCPNEHEVMRRSIGVPVQVSFLNLRIYLFFGERYVYELTVAGHSFSTYESTAAYIRSVSWITTPLNVAIAFCGLGIVAVALFMKVPE